MSHQESIGPSTEELVIESREALRDRAKKRAARLGDHFKREWQIYVLLLPTIIWFLLFLYKPMYGLQIAFKDYSIFRGIDGSPGSASSISARCSTTTSSCGRSRTPSSSASSACCSAFRRRSCWR